jgi:hypothetical protein
MEQPKDAMPGSLQRLVSQPFDRKLIMAFFRLGQLSRYQVCSECELITDADAGMCGQELWATAFKRAREQNKLEALADAIRKAG